MKSNFSKRSHIGLTLKKVIRLKLSLKFQNEAFEVFKRLRLKQWPVGHASKLGSGQFGLINKL